MRPVVIAAGGTGGHFFPAEALAEALIARGERIVLMTDRRRAEALGPVFGPREHFVIPGAGLAGRGMRAVSGALDLARGIGVARRLLRGLDPVCVVGFGGYPSVPPLLAARSLRPRVPILLHEQNAVMGRANRMLARIADRVAVSFAATAGAPAGAIALGNPVRESIRALAGQGPAPVEGHMNILVLGGSLGARVFSDIVPVALTKLPQPLRGRLSVVQQCRAEDLERVRAAYAAAGVAAELAPFFADVAARLAAAHLVIARAGASTVAELGVAGCPALLVPLPGAIDDHQTANARALAEAGGAIVMPQPAFTADAASGTIAALVGDPERLVAMAKAAATVGRADAAERLADLVHDLMPIEAHA